MIRFFGIRDHRHISHAVAKNNRELARLSTIKYHRRVMSDKRVYTEHVLPSDQRRAQMDLSQLVDQLFIDRSFYRMTFPRLSESEKTNLQEAN